MTFMCSLLTQSGSGFTIDGRVSGSWVRCVWRREPSFAIVPTPEQAGCKTWVELEEPLSTDDLAAVVDDAEWAARRERLGSILLCH